MRAHGICSVTASAHLSITVPTSASLPAFPTALASWGIPLLRGIRLTPAPGGEPPRVTPFLEVFAVGRGLTVRRETSWDAAWSTQSVVQPERLPSSRVSMSVLDQAFNPRRLVIPDDDSAVSSSACPYATLLGGMHRWILRDRLLLPLHGLSVSRHRGERASPVHQGERNCTSTPSKLSKTFSLSPSSLVLPPFRGNGSHDCAI